MGSFSLRTPVAQPCPGYRSFWPVFLLGRVFLRTSTAKPRSSRDIGRGHGFAGGLLSGALRASGRQLAREHAACEKLSPDGSCGTAGETRQLGKAGAPPEAQCAVKDLIRPPGTTPAWRRDLRLWQGWCRERWLGQQGMILTCERVLSDGHGGRLDRLSRLLRR